MTILEILKVARTKLTPSGAWTQGNFAKDANGHQVQPTSQAAVCWCAEGAIEAVTDSVLIDSCTAVSVMEATIGRLFSLASWNDWPFRTQEEVLAAFDEAIAEQERKAAK